MQISEEELLQCWLAVCFVIFIQFVLEKSVVRKLAHLLDLVNEFQVDWRG